jgi:predicted AlkP superfamily phosphohydrolase/phosphomutase
VTEAANVVVVGFDAMDACLAREMADRGDLPVVASLLERATTATTVNPPGLFVGGIWPSVATGTTPARHGFYSFQQIVNGTYDIQRFLPADILVEPFWRALSNAGRRCAVIDAPISTPTVPLQGIQLVEWGAHDRIAPFATSPPELASEVETLFGHHPVDRCDDYTRRGDPAALRADLLAGIETKTDLVRHYLAHGPWDLFFVVYSESHCAGHQFWALHDPTHPGHDAGLRAALGDPLEDVYRALDRSLGHLLDVMDDAPLMVLLSHGIGPHYDGDHLMLEITTRLEESFSRRSRRVVARERMIRGLDRRRRAARGATSVDGSRLFYRVPNNEVFGGIRINVRGREPRGRVAPGAELDDLVDELRAEFRALVDPESGRPVVCDVLSTSELYEGAALDLLPDLLVDWHRDAPIDAVSSPRIGTVRGTYDGVRTGDHRPPGLLLVRDPAIAPGPLPEPIPVVSLAPTIAARLDVELPGTDGNPIPALLPRSATDQR